MKKLCIGLIAVTFMLLPFMTGCSAAEEEIVEIREQFFMRQTQYILRNLDEFTGRTIRLEGVFLGWEDPTPAGNTYYFVMRFFADCCGDDGGSLGFELQMGNFEPFEDDAWVEVTGVLELQDSWQPNNPVLVVTAIEEMDTRGQAFVMP